METKLSAAIEERSTNIPSRVSCEHFYTHEFVHGSVNFDFDDVCVPGQGKIHVKSRLPRLQPKYERKHVEDCDIETLCSNLMVWTKDIFEIAGREEYFKEVCLTSVLFCAYTHPIPELYSEEMSLALKFFALTWYFDDIFEEAIEKKIHFTDLKIVTDQFHSILSGKYDNNNNATEQFESVQNYPAFVQLLGALLQLHNSWRNWLPNYEHRSKNFRSRMHAYFDSLVWFCVDEIDGRYSEESFKTFRKNVAGAAASVEFVALIHGITLTDAISNSPAVKRLLDTVDAIVTFSNDLLGMKKGFKNGEKDNLICFKVLEKRIPLDVATRQVCDIIASELIDYDLLKTAVIKEFDYDENLIKFLDIVESFIDGHNMMYSSTRYLIRGSVTLTR